MEPPPPPVPLPPVPLPPVPPPPVPPPPPEQVSGWVMLSEQLPGPVTQAFSLGHQAQSLREKYAVHAPQLDRAAHGSAPPGPVPGPTPQLFGTGEQETTTAARQVMASTKRARGSPETAQANEGGESYPSPGPQAR